MLLTFLKIWVGYLGQDVLRIVFSRFWPVMLDKTHSLKLVPFWIPSKPFYFCISLSFPVSFQKCNISSSALEGTCVDSLILYLLLLVLHFLFDLLRFYFAVVKMAPFLSPLMLILSLRSRPAKFSRETTQCIWVIPQEFDQILAIQIQRYLFSPPNDTFYIWFPNQSLSDTNKILGTPNSGADNPFPRMKTGDMT